MSGVEQDQRATPAARGSWAPDPTGVPGLDTVLGGGVGRGMLALIVGTPGSGKTTLAAQMAFAAAQAGRQVLFLAALPEPPIKLIAHLRTFQFFDERLLGGLIQVVAITRFLAGGLPAAAEAVTAEVRQMGASMVVLDGFGGMRGTIGSLVEARQFLYDLGTQLSMLGVTPIITSEGTPREWGQFPESSNADVLIGIHYGLKGTQGRRTLEAIKVRGAQPLSGLHNLEIGSAGARVYPRLEAQITHAPTALGSANRAPEQRAARAAFDLPVLDALLDGGLTTQTSTLLFGSPGAGKTLLGLYFALAGIEVGETTVFLGFHEAAEELRYKASAFTIGPRLDAALAPGGGLTLLRHPSVECNPDVVADDLLTAVDHTGARRVIVDSVAELERAVTESSGGERIPNFLAALLEALRLRGVTTLLIMETHELVVPYLIQQANMVSLIAANVIWLQQIAYRDRLYRVLSVPKMRFSMHDSTLREYTIVAPDGLQVLAPIESEAGVLTGLARQQEQPGSGQRYAP